MFSNTNFKSNLFKSTLEDFSKIYPACVAISKSPSIVSSKLLSAFSWATILLFKRVILTCSSFRFKSKVSLSNSPSKRISNKTSIFCFNLVCSVLSLAISSVQNFLSEALAVFSSFCSSITIQSGSFMRLRIERICLVNSSSRI